MKTPDLVFVGIKGSVIALDRATGAQVWATHLKGTDFVNIVLQDGIILASCYGEVFCLDPLTGHLRWHNRLKGFGQGIATLAISESLCAGNAQVIAAKRRRDDEEASAAATA